MSEIPENGLFFPEMYTVVPAGGKRKARNDCSMSVFTPPPLKKKKKKKVENRGEQPKKMRNNKTHLAQIKYRRCNKIGEKRSAGSYKSYSPNEAYKLANR